MHSLQHQAVFLRLYRGKVLPRPYHNLCNRNFTGSPVVIGASKRLGPSIAKRLAGVNRSSPYRIMLWLQSSISTVAHEL